MRHTTETDEGPLYRVRLGTGAATRGHRVICRWLGWAGAEDSLARVRIVHSTLSGYRSGQMGLIPRERLIARRDA